MGIFEEILSFFKNAMFIIFCFWCALGVLHFNDIGEELICLFGLVIVEGLLLIQNDNREG